jgi:hypothetical protein
MAESRKMEIALVGGLLRLVTGFCFALTFEQIGL